MTRQCPRFLSAFAFTTLAFSCTARDANLQAVGAQPPTRTLSAQLSDTTADPCMESSKTFVKRSLVALYGRHPLSQSELEQLTIALNATSKPDFLRQLMRSPEYVSYWAETLQDFLSFNRFGERMNDACAAPLLEDVAPSLAQHIRDNTPGGLPFDSEWSAADLFSSALSLDDLSPVYRATPFLTLGSRVIDADDDNDERAFRRLYSDLFAQNYLGRRMDCLQCHNSEYSVTPDTTFPLPGYVERAVLGDSGGRPHADIEAMFRVKGVLSMDFYPDNPGIEKWEYGDGHSPWGLAAPCGQFITPDQLEPDPFGSQGYLGTDLGPYSSIWDLEQFLSVGFQKLRTDGFVVAADGTVDGPSALVWMLSATLANKVWQHLSGQPLTAPHNLPRNASQQAILSELTLAFVEGGFSLRQLLIVALTQQVLSSPSLAKCQSSTPYTLPPVFNPWVVDNDIEDERLNSPADTIIRLPPALLLRALASALEWSEPSLVDLYSRLENRGGMEPDTEPMAVTELAQLQTDIGLFVSDAELGFRGSNFRGALAWEYALGDCRAPWTAGLDGKQPDDFVTQLSSLADTQTFGALAMELKNRLLAEPAIATDERVLLESLAGHSFDDLVSRPDAELGLRKLCSAWISTPDFQLGGLPASDSVSYESILDPHTPEAVCLNLASFWDGAVPGCAL